VVLRHEGDSRTEADWQSLFDARAAILEYDGGLPRAEAERATRGEFKARSPSQLVP
jgi:hypothetical protein